MSQILVVNKKEIERRNSREIRLKIEFLRASGDDNPPPQGKNLENKGPGKPDLETRRGNSKREKDEEKRGQNREEKKERKKGRKERERS